MYQRVGEYVTLYVALKSHFLLVSFKFKDIQNVVLLKQFRKCNVLLQ